jgi:hypothetical protein
MESQESRYKNQDKTTKFRLYICTYILVKYQSFLMELFICGHFS